ncbi:MAG TPA: hypothetical protein VKB61_09055 [Candidatus Acidoferrum sp.]|nr:hypothetical protein [Candidatus Acidoferrum sp.]
MKQVPPVLAALLLMAILAGGAEAQRNFGGFRGPDSRLIFLNCIRDPNQLQPTMDHMRAQYEDETAKRRGQRQMH